MLDYEYPMLAIGCARNIINRVCIGESKEHDHVVYLPKGIFVPLCWKTGKYTDQRYLMNISEFFPKDHNGELSKDVGHILLALDENLLPKEVNIFQYGNTDHTITDEWDEYTDALYNLRNNKIEPEQVIDVIKTAFGIVVPERNYWVDYTIHNLN